jgi:hypothetical protein
MREFVVVVHLQGQPLNAFVKFRYIIGGYVVKSVCEIFDRFSKFLPLVDDVLTLSPNF